MPDQQLLEPFSIFGVGPFYGVMMTPGRAGLRVHVSPEELRRIERLVGDEIVRARIPEHQGGATICDREVKPWRS